MKTGEERFKSLGQPFQTAMLANLLKFPEVLSLAAAYVPADYFDSDIHAHLAAIAYVYYRRYKTPPTREALISILGDEVERGKIDADYIRSYARVVEKLLKRTTSDRQYVKDRLSTFIKRQALAEAIYKSVDLLAEEKFDEIRTEVSGALAAGELDFGHFYTEGIEDRIVRRGQMLDEPIPTLIRELDSRMRGGLRRKELGVLMAPPGRGKSVGLSHFAKAAMVLNNTVGIYTLEMSEDRIADRLDSSLSGLPHGKLVDYPAEVKERVAKLARPNSLLIKEWPTKKATADMIRAHLDSGIGSGFRPDMIVVDYGDIMASVRGYKERRHEVASNFEELRAIASEYDIAVWTATQARRDALDKAVITMADIAESFEKCAIADVILSICQTDEEREDRQLRLYIAKNRDNPAEIEVGPFFSDFSRMSFYVQRDPMRGKKKKKKETEE